LRYLAIVSRRETGLFDYLRALLASDPKTRVLLDRRGVDGEPTMWKGSERRRRPDYWHDLVFQRVIVMRARTEPGTPEGEGVLMSHTETSVADDRERVTHWIDESQYVVGRLIPGLLDDRDRWRGRVLAAEEEIEQLRSELGEARRTIAQLESECRDWRGEQGALAEAFQRTMDHLAQMQPSLGEIAKRLAHAPTGSARAD
jgi:hypothetical protein